MNTLLSFIIPCYRSEKTIQSVVDEIIDVVGQKAAYHYEIIAVNDHSPDKVYEILKQLAAENPSIKVVNLAKNMGKHAAVLAGCYFARGRYIINLDDDGQCPVNELWRLIRPLEEDQCDCTVAKYVQKKESLFKRFGSDVNLKISEWMLNKPAGLRFENFSAFKSFVRDEIVNYKHPYPYLEGLIMRVTHQVQTVSMEERERGDNRGSGFTLRKSLALLLNGLTAFSVKPLRVATVTGCLFAMFGFIFGIRVIIRKLLNPGITVGYSSMTAILLFSSGLIMIMLGIIGEYIGRIYICINDSPQYVIRETINLDSNERKIS